MYVCPCLLWALIIVETETLNIEGQVGKNVTTRCENTDVQTNVKYICESPCNTDKYIIMKANYGETINKNRIEIFNGGDVLYVTFINLRTSDSRKYYCGVEKFGFDPLIELNLKVTHGPVTVPVGSTVSYVDIKSSTVPATKMNIIADLSDSYTTFYTAPTASASQRSGRVMHLTIGVIVILTILIVLLWLMSAARRRLKVVSSAGSQQEDAQVEAEYSEIRHEDLQTESQPATSTASFSTATTDVDPDSLYANYSYLQHVSSLEIGLKGACAESYAVYSVAQLPNRKIEQARECEPTQSKSNENDFLYSLAQLPQAT